MEELNILLKLFVAQIPGIIIGVVSALVIFFGTGLIKEFFDERNRISKYKRDVARQVLKICAEAIPSPKRNYHYYKFSDMMD